MARVPRAEGPGAAIQAITHPRVALMSGSNTESVAPDHNFAGVMLVASQPVGKEAQIPRGRRCGWQRKSPGAGEPPGL